MIDESITVHDQYQFEIKLGYRLHKEAKITSYGIDAYIFMPNSLGVNRGTYSKAQFYTDMQAYIRLMSPEAPLDQIALESDASPLQKLKAAFQSLVMEVTDETIARYEGEIKIFCCILKSTLHDYFEFVKKISDVNDRCRMAEDFLRHGRAIESAYRNLRSVVQVPSVPEKLFSVYQFGDEYISLLLEDHSYLFLERVLVEDRRAFADVRAHMIDFIEEEVEYRRQRKYRSIPDETSDNEQLVFRKSVLKKYMSSVLFLDAHAEPEGIMLEQVLLGIAAGLAMFFATAVAFVTQSVYGSLTLPVFVALVVSYVFKDRIKDILRLYLSRKMTSRLFDHHMDIITNTRRKAGLCRESFEFVDEAKIPAVIRQMRSRDHITEIENGWVGEKVVLYRKRICLFNDQVLKACRGHAVEGINDIMRFSVLEFIRKMDNPKKQLYIVDEDEYQRIKGERVYHLNLILKYTLPKRILYKRFRIVLSRKRIKRIEPVAEIEAPPESPE
jgi:hypothetical protein